MVDFAERTKPRMISRLSFSPPFQANIAVHTAVPLRRRKLVAVNSEAIAEECREPLGFAGLVDVTSDTSPALVSLFPLPAPPPGAPFRNVCEHGGRFGPHNQHQAQQQRVLLDRDDVIFLTYFNAGLRIVDASDAR